MIAIKNKNIKWWIGVTSCTLLFVVIGVFSYMKMSFLLNGVQINAKIEKSDDSSLVVVSGKAENATYINLNGREIFIDKDGSFKESISLIPGFSVITIYANDKFGNNKVKKFQMMYKGESPAVAFSSNKKIINN